MIGLCSLTFVNVADLFKTNMGKKPHTLFILLEIDVKPSGAAHNTEWWLAN